MAKSGWKKGKSPTDWARLMERRRSRLAKRLGVAITEITDDVTTAAKDLAIVAKRVSKQDAPAGKERTLTRRTPVRRKVNRRAYRGIVMVQGFWTGARSKAIQDIFARHGMGQQLLRKWLYVRRGEFVKNGPRGQRAIEKVNISRDPGVRRWAINLGQHRRHVIYVSDPRVKRDLVLAASLNRTRPKRRATFRKAVKQGLR